MSPQFTHLVFDLAISGICIDFLFLIVIKSKSLIAFFLFAFNF